MNKNGAKSAADAIEKEKPKTEKFIEEVDFYFENNLMVLTAHFLKKRGYCCDNNCRHCPYKEAKN